MPTLEAISFSAKKLILYVLCYALHMCTLGGSHTLSKTVTTSSVGGLSSFVKKKSSCISCRAPLSDNSWVNSKCYIPQYLSSVCCVRMCVLHTRVYMCVCACVCACVVLFLSMYIHTYIYIGITLFASTQSSCIVHTLLYNNLILC